MKLKTSPSIAGFTLSEMLVSLSLSSIVLAAAITCGISLQKSFAAIDNYFSTEMQQIRIIDYLNRDVKRGLVVTTSVDLQSVTMSVPKYIIQAGDPEAIADPETIGTPRTPTVAYTRLAGQLQPIYHDGGLFDQRQFDPAHRKRSCDDDCLKHRPTRAAKHGRRTVEYRICQHFRHFLTNLHFRRCCSGAHWHESLCNCLFAK